MVVNFAEIEEHVLCSIVQPDWNKVCDISAELCNYTDPTQCDGLNKQVPY